MVQRADLLRSHTVKEIPELKGEPDDRQTEVHLKTPYTLQAQAYGWTDCLQGPTTSGLQSRLQDSLSLTCSADLISHPSGKPQSRGQGLMCRRHSASHRCGEKDVQRVLRYAQPHQTDRLIPILGLCLGTARSPRLQWSQHWHARLSESRAGALCQAASLGSLLRPDLQRPQGTHSVSRHQRTGN